MKPQVYSSPDFIVYLLHCYHEVEPSHYVGITRPHRLEARMREHAAGRGSIFTNNLCVLDLTWALATTFPTTDRSLEKKIAGLRPVSSVCPVCKGCPPMKLYKPTKTAASGEDAAAYQGFNLGVEFRKTPATLVMKKGTKPTPRPLFPTRGRT